MYQEIRFLFKEGTLSWPSFPSRANYSGLLWRGRGSVLLDQAVVCAYDIDMDKVLSELDFRIARGILRP